MPSHLAEVNVGRMRASLADPVMAPFVALLDEINAAADASDGFVWRLKGDDGNATYVRPYDDERVLFNLSVWRTAEQLRAYTYHGAHATVLRQRRQWFHEFGRPALALWWVPAGHLPTIEEGMSRLQHLQAHGSSPFAFNFTHIFPPPPLAG